MRGRIILVLAGTLLISACAPDDVVDFVETFDGAGTLADADDPAVRTAADTADEIQTIVEAEENLDLAFGDEWEDPLPIGAQARLDVLEHARNLRPSDPRYDFYEAVAYGLRVSSDASPENSAFYIDAREDALFRAADKLASSHSKRTPEERARIAHELYMDAMRDVIDRLSASPERDALRGTYCVWITVLYPNYHAESFPADTTFYLTTSADRSVCEA